MTDPSIALLFDMDGVIIDSTAVHTAAWEEYLSSHGISVPYLAGRMLGKYNDEIVRDFFGGSIMTADEVTAHGRRKEALYRARMDPILSEKLVPGAVEFIRSCRARPLAVASNAEAANTRFVLEQAGIGDCFRAIVTGDDVERPKPEPDIFLKAAELLGVPPRDCVVFEDSLPGVAAARRAGMHVVAVLTTLPRFDNVDLEIHDFESPALRPWLASFAGFVPEA